MINKISKNNLLPDGWSNPYMGDFIELKYGKALKKIDRKNNGKVPVFGSSGIVGHHSSALVHSSGLIVGRKGSVGSVYLCTSPFWAIDTTYFIEQDENLDLKYLYYVLKSLNLSHLDKSTAIPGLSRDDAYKKRVPIAPLNEQKRIIEKIEQLFSDLDAGVEILKAIKKQVRQYRQSVLKYAFEGKLTAEWRKKNKPEPASKLLEKIAKEKERKSEGKKQKKLPPLDTSDLPEMPQGWEWAKLDDIADIKGGMTKDQKKKYHNGRSIPYLRVANVQRGYLDLSEIKEIQASEDIIQSLLLVKGDILFTEGGDRDKLGRGCVWNNEIPECIHQNHIFRARLYSNQIDSQVISWHGNTFGQIYFMKQGKQTTNLASINLTKLRNFPVPVIPPKEQEIMISEIERHYSIADKIEEVVETALKQSNRLRQSVLKRAFEGRLVHQDPNDEPVEILLERIRKEQV